MTDIDIERLRKWVYRQLMWDSVDGTLPVRRTVLALIERLEKAEAQRDRMTVCYEHPENAPSDVALMDAKAAWAYGWNECKDVIMANRDGTDE